MSEPRKPKIVLVISDPMDSRVKEFGNLFVGVSELYLAHGNGNYFSRVSNGGELNGPLKNEHIPESVHALMVHGSDLEASLNTIKVALSKGLGRTFIFNGPGNPPRKEGFIRILRTTNPFSLTTKHAKELCEFVLDTTGRKPLPSCCFETAKHLIALDILCQGHLFTHEPLEAINSITVDASEEVVKSWRKNTDSIDWWFTALGVKSKSDLESRLKEEHVSDEDASNVVNILEKALSKPAGTPKPLQTIEQLRENVKSLLA